MTILVDHNLKGQALLLWGTLAAEGWFTLLVPSSELLARR